MLNKKYIYGFVALAMFATMAAATPALAEDNSQENQPNMGGMMGHSIKIKPVIFGTVSAISGNTVTLSGKHGLGTNTVTTTYTVDATNAKITKNNAPGTISSIAVGDTIVARGSLTGTNMVAIMIRDGQIMPGVRKGFDGNKEDKTPPASPITGSGQPIVAGTVSSVNGSTLSITNKGNITYTIDATNAKIVKGPNVVTLSTVAVGDMVIVQGDINGSSVTASSIIDQNKPVGTADSGTNEQTDHKGFFGGIGSFLSRVFGF